MAKTNIGRVSIVPAGEYSSLIEYKRLTAVSYQGNMYISRTECLGIEPTNEDYWFKAVDKGAKGDKGDKGDTGKDFSIYKTYPSISAMEADINNVPEGSFVMIASDVEDEDNSKLYVKSETSFVYITDMSGATGMKGDKGDKGDKPVKGVDYFTQQDIDSMVSEITDDANSVFNQNVTSKTNDFNTNATEKTGDFNDNYTEKLNNINSASTTAVSNVNNAGTTAVGNVETAEDTAINNIETAEESTISDINTAKNGAIEEINSQDNVGRIDDLEIISAKNKKNIDLLLNNFENAETEGTKIDLESTAEAPLEVVEIAGNTIQNGEPSLDNEVEVTGVTRNTEISLKNKNQLILEDVAETTYYGVSYSCKSGKISLNGTASQSIFIIIPLKNPIKVSKQFTWSALTNKILSTEKEVALWLSNETGSKLFNKDLWLEDTVDRVFTTTPAEETLITKVSFYISSGFHFDNIEVETQLEYSANASTIVEAQEQLHTFSLGDLILYGDENARDVFNVTIDQDFYEKTGYRKITNLDLVKNWKKYIVKNTDIFIQGTPSNRYYLNTELNNKNYFAKSNYFKSGIENNFNVDNTVVLQTNRINLVVDNYTEEQLNAKLQELNTAGHPFYVVYQLDTPETENITDQTLINQIENFINNSYTYKQATSINSDFYLKLNYRKNMYYDLENRISALEQASTTSNTQE